MYSRALKNASERPVLSYRNFIDKHKRKERKAARNVFKRVSLINAKLNMSNYWTMLGRTKFVVSPPGKISTDSQILCNMDAKSYGKSRQWH